MVRRFPGIVCMLLILSAAPVGAQDALTRPVGRWERKLPEGGTVILTVEETRLHLYAGKDDDVVALHADYSMTREGVLFGVVTSAEVPDGVDVDEQHLMDDPLSIVYRLDEGVLVVRDFRIAALKKDELDLLRGRYEKTTAPPDGQAIQKKTRTNSRRNRERSVMPFPPPLLGDATPGVVMGAITGHFSHDTAAGVAIGAVAGGATGGMSADSNVKNEIQVVAIEDVKVPKLSLPDIGRMAEKHIPDALILSDIHAYGKPFTLTVDQINYLHTKGVSDQIILAMQHVEAPPTIIMDEGLPYLTTPAAAKPTNMPKVD